MKTMTCRQMGGPCDAQLHGMTAEEMMSSGAAHVKMMAEKGDEGHKKVLAMIEEMQKNPESGKEWNEKFMKNFAALSEE